MSTPAEGARSADVVAEVLEAAARQEEEGAVPAVFLAEVRAAAARLGAAEVAADDIRGALALLEGQAPIDVDAPVASGRRSVVLAKKGFRRVARWYVRHLALQVSALGEAVVRVETALAARLEAVEERVDEVGELRERVERLEAAARRSPGSGRGGAGE